MRIELNQVVWMDEHAVSRAELVELSGLTPELLDQLIDAGGIEPLPAAAPEPRFGARALSAARQARRLQQDFELDVSALLLVLGLHERIEELESQLRALRAKLPPRLR